MLLGARYYDPMIGRFIAQDPDRDGLNWYEYAGNNPVMNIDPTGFGYWKDVGNVFYGYGQCIAGMVNPVGWYRGGKAIIKVARQQGVRKAAGVVGKAVARGYTDAFTTTDAREYGRSVGNIIYWLLLLQSPRLTQRRDRPQERREKLEMAQQWQARRQK